MKALQKGGIIINFFKIIKVAKIFQFNKQEIEKGKKKILVLIILKKWTRLKVDQNKNLMNQINYKIMYEKTTKKVEEKEVILLYNKIKLKIIYIEWKK